MINTFKHYLMRNGDLFSKLRSTVHKVARGNRTIWHTLLDQCLEGHLYNCYRVTIQIGDANTILFQLDRGYGKICNFFYRLEQWYILDFLLFVFYRYNITLMNFS